MANYILPFALEVPLRLGAVSLSVFISEQAHQTGEVCLSIPHNHNDYELFYFAKGAGEMTVSAASVTYTEGDLLLLQPKEYHCQEKEHMRADTVRYGIFFSIHPPAARASREEKAGYEALLSVFSSFRILKDEERLLLPTLRTLAREMRERKDGFYSYVHAAATLLFTELLRLSGADLSRIFPTEEPHNTGYYRNQIERFLRYRYMDKVTLADLAAALSVSPRQAARLMRASFGVSFVEKLTELRIEQAKHLLRRGMSSEEVASACGFGSYSYFATCFRSCTGMSPRAFRASVKPASST